MKWSVKIGICFSLPESRTCNGSSRSQKLKEAEPDLLIIGLELRLILPEEPALQMFSKADKLTCIIYLSPPAVQDHFSSEASLTKKKKKKWFPFQLSTQGLYL